MNKKIKIFLIISAVERSGPSLGAIAMLRLLEKFPDTYEVKLISRFKKEKSFIIDEKNIIYTKNYFRTLFFLISKKKRNNIFCLSYDIKMDFINVITRKINYVYIRANNLDNYSTTFGKFFGKTLYKFHIFLLNNCEGILVLSETQKNVFINSNFSFIDKITVLPNFIDEIPITDIKKIKNSYLIISSLIKRKRVYQTLNAFITAFRDNEDCSLTIIGNGDQHTNIKSLISDNNKCSIRIINKSINPISFLEESEYFILMSESEGLSRASLEASYYNCKMILSNIDVHNEFYSEHALIVNSFHELLDEFRLINDGKTLLNSEFPDRCKSSNIEKKIKLIVNQCLN